MRTGQFIASIVLFAHARAEPNEQKLTELSVLEMKLGELVQGSRPASLTISPDRKRVAFFRTSPDGKKWSLVVDGDESEDYDAVGDMKPLFSLDSKHLAFVAGIGDQNAVVLDGVAGKKYGVVGGVTFSPDSHHIAYMGSAGAERFIVVDGVEQSLRFDGLHVSGPIFSPDSQHLAYTAKQDSKWFVVIDGKQGPEYDGAGELVFSPDSKHWACFALRGDKSLVLLDGIESAEYDAILYDSPLVFTAPYTVEALVRRDQQFLRITLSNLGSKSAPKISTTTQPRKKHHHDRHPQTHEP